MNSELENSLIEEGAPLAHLPSTLPVSVPCRTVEQSLTAGNTPPVTNDATDPAIPNIQELLDANLALEVRALQAEAQAIVLAQELAAARESTQSKSMFLASMSHELRTPLTAILGFGETLFSEGDILRAPPHRIEAVQTILRNGEHLLSLINDILDLSKIESGKLEMESLPCELVTVIQDTVTPFVTKAAKTNVQVELTFTGEIPTTIQTDPTRLRQILNNLLSNAMKFTQQGKIRVEVACQKREPGVAELTCLVADSGIGMTPDQMKRLFLPYIQAEKGTARKFGGTGLGLTITRHLAQLMGGDVSVSSEPGRGSTFRVQILADVGEQVTWSAPSAIPAASLNVKPAAPPTQSPSGIRVLLAEDGVDNQRLISVILRKSGAEVVIADNGKLAMTLAQSAVNEGNPFDLILMDVQMPVMDGLEATRLLREAGYTAPIVALTAHAMKGDRDRCIEAGCDEYQSKPLRRDQLLQLTNRFCKARPTANST